MVHDSVLALHIASGVAGLLLGPVALLVSLRRGRHTRAAGAYHWSVLAVCLSAIALAALDWSALWWFVPLALLSYGNALLGHLAGRVRWRGWLRHHIAGLGGSYIALVTAVLVVSAEGAPIAWVLPTVIGVPLIELATARLRRGPLRAHFVRS